MEVAQQPTGVPDGWQVVSATPPPASAPADGPRMGPPTGNEPVTLGDLKADPLGSIQRIGALLKKDATDPKLWAGLVVSYLGSKALPYAMPAIAKSLGSLGRGAKAIGGVVEPGDIGIISPRIGKAVDLAARVRGAMAPAAKVNAPPATSPVESVSGGTPPPAGPPPAEAPAVSPKNSLPDQKALNEQAIAQRRAAYQAKQAAQAPDPTWTKPEADLYLKLRVAGKTDQQARAAVEASKALNQQLGLKTPTEAETKFPKGFRGKTPSE